MALPDFVRFRNQNSAIITISATPTVSAWVERSARPSSSPVISRKSRTAIRKRAPSSKRISSTPIRMRVRPFITNITPTEAITKMIGAAFCRR